MASIQKDIWEFDSMRSAVLLVMATALITSTSAICAEKPSRSACKQVCEKSVQDELTATEKRILKQCTAGKFNCGGSESELMVPSKQRRN
jgi:hypothetical protein